MLAGRARDGRSGGCALLALVTLLMARIVLVGTERVLLRGMGEHGAPTVCTALFFGVGALVLLPFSGLWQVRDWAFLRLAIPSGALYAVAYWFYVAALSAGDVSAVAPLSGVSTVLVVGLAALFHGEALTTLKVCGALLIAGGAASLQRAGGVPGPGGAGTATLPALQMLAYAFLNALTRMLDKANAGAVGAMGAAAYGFVVFSVVAVAAFGLLAVQGGLAGCWRLLRRLPLVTLGAGLCNGGSFLLLLLALTAIPVSVAEPVTALSLLVTAALAALCFREPLGQRWLFTLLVVGGVWLIVLG